MEKQQTMKIVELWDLQISNAGQYGGALKIVLIGKNTNGKKVKVSIDAEMFFASDMAIRSKKAITNFNKRVSDMKNDFLKQLENND